MHGNIKLEFIDAASIFVVLIKCSVPGQNGYVFPESIINEGYGIPCKITPNTETPDIPPNHKLPPVGNAPVVTRPDDGVHPVLVTCLPGQISDPYGGAEVGIANPEQGIHCMWPLAESIIPILRIWYLRVLSSKRISIRLCRQTTK